MVDRKLSIRLILAEKIGKTIQCVFSLMLYKIKLTVSVWDNLLALKHPSFYTMACHLLALNCGKRTFLRRINAFIMNSVNFLPIGNCYGKWRKSVGMRQLASLIMGR